jgi:acetyl-CoA carboxylase carboxyl transferase subunit alpha
MKTTFLEFEQPIAELENRIEELRFVQDDSAVDISEEIQRLTKRSQTLTKDIYGKLSPWQVAQVARHPQRPFTLDYIQTLFTHFEELHGDRTFEIQHRGRGLEQAMALLTQAVRLADAAPPAAPLVVDAVR